MAQFGALGFWNGDWGIFIFFEFPVQGLRLVERWFEHFDDGEP